MARSNDPPIMAFMYQVVTLPFAMFLSLFGLAIFKVLLQGVANVKDTVRKSNIDIVRKTVYPYLRDFLSYNEAVFGKSFSPNATHVLLGAIVVAIVLSRK